MKSVDICSDIPTIDGSGGASATSEDALGFRYAAIEHIAIALPEAGSGDWLEPGLGMGEVNFDFDMQYCEAAEAAVPASVEGTPFANRGKIARSEFDPADFV